MPFMGYCRLCHYLDATVKQNHLVDFFIDHSEDRHKGNMDFHIWRISATDFQHFLEAKVNSKFWEAWRIIKQAVKVEARVKTL